MASDRLGKRIDIHSGGIDLAFPHHDNELAQSEAYWYDERTQSSEQWVNYFLHMGHLSISGSKMSKSLKNFTTVRESLSTGTWTARSLRINFLLGDWREGIGITEELTKAGRAWEEKLNNFFWKTKGYASAEGSASDTDSALAGALVKAQGTVYEALLDSFNTHKAMNAISDLAFEFNNADKSTLNPQDVKAAALWVTKMTTVFGLNGAASSETLKIGWEGIDIPEPAKPYVYPLSTLRDSLRKAAKAKTGLHADDLRNIVDSRIFPEDQTSNKAKPYADLLSNIRAELLSLDKSSNISKDVLAVSDRVRDVDLLKLGIYLEDQENEPALVRPASKELVQARTEKAEVARQQRAKKPQSSRGPQNPGQGNAKGKMSHLQIFKTPDYSEWDADGLPVKDAAGEALTKSRSKKLRKDWERHKRLHGTWRATIEGDATSGGGVSLVGDALVQLDPAIS